MQKQAYVLRISVWSSDVCSSDLFGMATCAASAIFGRFLDAGAPRTLLAIGVLALAAGLMLVAAAPTLWSVYLIFLLIFPISMVFAGQLVAISLITRAFENRRGLALGITITGGSIGRASIPTVCPALNAHRTRDG